MRCQSMGRKEETGIRKRVAERARVTERSQRGSKRGERWEVKARVEKGTFINVDGGEDHTVERNRGRS